MTGIWGDKLIRETEGIVLWCLEGLHRLVRNGFEFSISDRAKKNLKDLMENENNIISFLNSSGYVRREEGTYASSRQLYFCPIVNGARIIWKSPGRRILSRSI